MKAPPRVGVCRKLRNFAHAGTHTHTHLSKAWLVTCRTWIAWRGSQTLVRDATTRRRESLRETAKRGWVTVHGGVKEGGGGGKERMDLAVVMHHPLSRLSVRQPSNP